MSETSANIPRLFYKPSRLLLVYMFLKIDVTLKRKHEKHGNIITENYIIRDSTPFNPNITFKVMTNII